MTSIATIISTISDIGIKRLYKFILKRVIGRYLKDELLIEQLEVSSRQGYGNIVINNIDIDVDVINNDYLRDCPFQLSSCHISILKANINYGSILDDGCSFDCTGVDIVILPKKHNTSNTNDTKTTNTTDHKDHKDTNNDKKCGKSVEGQEGLSLIANWIEVIIQRIKITVNNLRIRIADNDDASSNINTICISIPTIEYYNTHPSSISSVSISANDQRQSMSGVYDLGRKKLIKIIAGFHVELAGVPLLRTSDDISIVVKALNTIDIDVRLKQLQANVNTNSILILVNMLLVYSANIYNDDNSDANSDFVDNNDAVNLPKQTLKTLMWLQDRITKTNDNNGEMGGDTFATIIDLIKKYRSAQAQLQVSDMLSNTDNVDNSMFSTGDDINDDDIEFPIDNIENDNNINSDNDDEDDETQYEDAMERRSVFKVKMGDSIMKSVNFLEQSSYGNTGTYGKGTGLSETFHSIKSVNNLKMENDKMFSFHMYLEGLSLTLNDTNTTESIGHDQLIIAAENLNINTTSSIRSDMNKNTVALTISKLSVSEHCSTDTNSINDRKVLNFHYARNNRNSIIEPDHFESLVDTSTGDDNVTNVNIVMKMQLTILSVYPSSLARWSVVVATLLESLAPQSSPLSLLYSLGITIPDIDILLHPDNNGHEYWADLLDSVDILNNPSKWSTPARTITNHLSQSRGGLRISASNFSLSSSSLDSTIEVDDITMKIFLALSSNYMESLIATASGNGQSNVVLRKLHTGNQNTNVNAKKKVATIISIAAATIRIDVGQREYNALLSISKALTQSNDNNSINTNNNDAGLGIVFESSTAVIALSQTNYNTADSSYTANDPVCIFTVASRPVIEFHVTSVQTSISMKAENLSMYELSMKELESVISNNDAAGDLKPFLHKSTFSYPDTVDENRNPHVLSFELIFNDEYDFHTNASLNSKSVTFMMMFDDVTLAYDPLSKWLLKFVDILIPLSPRQILAKRVGFINHIDSSATYTNPYEVTNIAVSVNKGLIDYSCMALNSRALISVGNLIISSTMVTNNPTFSLKFSVNDFHVRLSNSSTKRILLQQSTLPQPIPNDFGAFLALNLFVDILSIDHLENLITFHSTTSPLSIKLTMGIIRFVARIDSLDLLSSTLLSWWDDAKSTLESSIEKDEEYFDTSDDNTKTDAPIVAPIKPIVPLKANWLDEVTNDTFKKLSVQNNTSCINTDDNYNLKSQYAYKKDGYSIDENYLRVDDIIDENKICSKNVTIEECITPELADSSEAETEARWLPRYDYCDDDYNGLDFGEKVEDEFDVDSIIKENSFASDDENDEEGNDIDTTTTTNINRSVGMSFCDFYNHTKPKIAEELEMQEILNIHHTAKLDSMQTVDSDIDSNEKHMDDNITDVNEGTLFIDTTAKSVHYDDLPDINFLAAEEKAIWLINPADIIIQPHYISLTLLDDNDVDDIPDSERLLKVDTFISLKANIKIKIYEGFDWTNDDVNFDSKPITHRKKDSSLFANPRASTAKPSKKLSDNENKRGRNMRDCLIISATNANLRVRIYKKKMINNDMETSENNLNKSNFMYQCPSQRISINSRDFLLTFLRKEGTQKKILGLWRSTRVPPRQLNQPQFQINLIGYESGQCDENNNAILEHRLEATVQPLRCFLDEFVIDFVRNLSLHLSIVEAMKAKFDDNYNINSKVNRNPALLYLQCICIPPVQMKIDYTPGNLNINSLRAGEYIQLLNLLPVSGLELVLKQTKLSGVSGLRKAFDLIIESWVKDIYANQIHRIISGTSPFKGLSTIGAGLHDLLVIPLKDYRKSGGVVKDLKKTTSTLVKTVTKEALLASHHITMLLARGISELVRENDPNISRLQSSSSSKHVMTKVMIPIQRQPKNIRAGLARAYQSLSREVNATVETVIAVPIRQWERDGPGGALRCVIRAIPIAILRQVIGASEAVSFTCLGLRNSIDNDLTADEDDMLNFHHIPESETI